MNIDTTLDLCVDMLLFLNHTDLEGEPNIGIKMDREEHEWTIDFRDYNDESLFSKTGNDLDELLTQVHTELAARVRDLSTEAGGLLEKSQALLARTP
jgi:hypothetical protein